MCLHFDTPYIPESLCDKSVQYEFMREMQSCQTEMLSQTDISIVTVHLHLLTESAVWSDMVHSQSTGNSGCTYRMICSVCELQWDNTDVTERCNFQDFSLEPAACFCSPWDEHSCVFGVYVCAAVIEQRMLLYRPVAVMSPPQTHCMLHVFSCMLMCCCPHVCFLIHCLLREAWASVQCFCVPVEDSFRPGLDWL